MCIIFTFRFEALVNFGLSTSGGTNERRLHSGLTLSRTLKCTETPRSDVFMNKNAPGTFFFSLVANRIAALSRIITLRLECTTLLFARQLNNGAEHQARRWVRVSAFVFFASRRITTCVNGHNVRRYLSFGIAREQYISWAKVYTHAIYIYIYIRCIWCLRWLSSAKGSIQTARGGLISNSYCVRGHRRRVSTRRADDRRVGVKRTSIEIFAKTVGPAKTGFDVIRIKSNIIGAVWFMKLWLPIYW